jgi:hypothetical protein
LARVIGHIAGSEGDVEAVSTTNVDSDGKATLTVHSKILPGNIQLRNTNRSGTLIEKGDFAGSGLPYGHSTKTD